MRDRLMVNAYTTSIEGRSYIRVWNADTQDLILELTPAEAAELAMELGLAALRAGYPE
jgi:hypothetical protein